MDPTEVHERVTADRIEGQLGALDTVVDVRDVANAGRSVRQ